MKAQTTTTPRQPTTAGSLLSIGFMPALAILALILLICVQTRAVFRQQIAPAVDEIEKIVGDAKDIREVEGRLESFCGRDTKERVIETRWMTSRLQFHWTCKYYAWEREGVTTVYISVHDRMTLSPNGTRLKSGEGARDEGSVAIGIDRRTLDIEFRNYQR